MLITAAGALLDSLSLFREHSFETSSLSVMADAFFSVKFLLGDCDQIFPPLVCFAALPGDFLSPPWVLTISLTKVDNLTQNKHDAKLNFVNMFWGTSFVVKKTKTGDR